MNRLGHPTRGERTRAHIIDCAAALFWQRSFHGVSVDQVADTADVNKATVYRYFADKRDLASSVIRHNGAITLETVFIASFAEFAKPQDRLAAIYRVNYCTHRQMHDASGDVFGCPLVGLTLELGQEMPEVREEAARIFEEVERYLTIIAKDAAEQTASQVDAQAVGRTLVQLLHGANASSRLTSDPNLILEAGYASLALIGYPDTSILPEAVC